MTYWQVQPRLRPVLIEPRLAFAPLEAPKEMPKTKPKQATKADPKTPKKLTLEELEAKVKAEKPKFAKPNTYTPRKKLTMKEAMKEGAKKAARKAALAAAAAAKPELKGLAQRAAAVRKMAVSRVYRIARGEYPCLCGCGNTCSKLFCKGHVSRFLKLLDTKGLKYTTNRLKEAYARLQKHEPKREPATPKRRAKRSKK